MVYILYKNEKDDEIHKIITREEFIEFARDKEEDKNFSISSTIFGLMVSKIDFITRHKPSGRTIYTINLLEMRNYLNEQKYIGCLIE